MSPVRHAKALSTMMADVSVILALSHLGQDAFVWPYLVWFIIGDMVCQAHRILPPGLTRVSYRWGLRYIWWRAWWPYYLLRL